MRKSGFVFVVLIYLASAQGYWELVEFEDQNVKCIAQHPQDTTIMLISIADSIFRSSDGGHTWSLAASFWPLPVNNVTFDPVFGDTVYAVIGNGSWSDGIYRSTDAGLTWNILEWFLYPRCMCVPDYPPFFMLIGCDSLGVYKSADGGNSWEEWNDGLTDLHVYALDYCCPFDSFPLLYTGTAHGLFCKYADGWFQANGIPTDLRVSSISYHRQQEIGFATVTGGSWSDGIYRSTDYGQNWQVVDWWLYSSCVAMNSLWLYYPDDTCSVFAGDSGLGVKRSTDCGTTWHEANTGLGNLYINAFSYHPEDTLRLFCATQGGLYRYIYAPGINEDLIGVPGNFFEIPSTIVRAHEPILIKCCTIERGYTKTFELKIIDATGRKIRTEKITNNKTFLKPLKKSGIYFIVSSHPEYYYQKKLIVID